MSLILTVIIDMLVYISTTQNWSRKKSSKRQERRKDKIVKIKLKSNLPSIAMLK